MGLIERVSRAIAEGGISMDDHEVRAEARRILSVESPLRAVQTLQPIVDEIVGMGPIQGLFDDPEVTDILVNGPEEVWVERDGELSRTAVRFHSTDHLVAVIERLVAPLGLRIDRSAPMLDARLPDGSRLHAVLPPASVDRPLLAIRRFIQRLELLGDLVQAGTATKRQVDVLREAVASRRTIVVSGGTGAGKTTLLNLLGEAIPGSERVVLIEDAAELALPGHVVRLEARPANVEGAGEITIRSLLRSALRLRPDRLIVGEVRGPEALELVWALNTGHRGSLTTVHANSPREAVWRIETLALAAGVVSEQAISRQLRASVDLVVQIDRQGPHRRITSIATMQEILEEERS